MKYTHMCMMKASREYFKGRGRRKQNETATVRQNRVITGNYDYKRAK